MINIFKKSTPALFLLICVFNAPFGFAQFTIPEKPDFQTSVYDYAHLLSDSEKSQLETKLIRYSDSTSTQIVVVTIDEIKGEDIGILAPKWGHAWGVGQKKEDNGIFILLAKKERKIWIAPGYGVEDRLIAAVNGEIIDNVILPEFRAGSYYNGLDKGSDAIFKVLKGKYKGTRKHKPNDQNIPIGVFVIIFIIIIILISRNKGNGRGGNGIGGPSLLDIIVLSSLGRNSGSGFGGGGGFGGSSGGGGFGGGFGGGGFSGGGAGGSW
jgi:uncharacterized protein